MTLMDNWAMNQNVRIGREQKLGMVFQNDQLNNKPSLV